jgi:putative hydrolase of the HAD superfamily
MRESSIIGFDADDTLWVNEPFFREAEAELCRILAPWLPAAEVHRELYRTEMLNLEPYGYGVKAFVLSMIETAVRVSGQNIGGAETEEILRIGKKLLDHPVVLLDQVETVLKKLKPHYKLILATKGDLLDQERKLEKSGLAGYFHHIEIMSDKHEKNYRRLIRHLDIKPEQFVMIGNSVKSDILPVIRIGAKAIHVPSEITWLHETQHDQGPEHVFTTVEKIADILPLLGY